MDACSFSAQWEVVIVWRSLFSELCVNNGLEALLWYLPASPMTHTIQTGRFRSETKRHFLQHDGKWLVWQTEKCQVLPWFARKCDKRTLKTIRVLYNESLFVRSWVFFIKEEGHYSLMVSRGRDILNVDSENISIPFSKFSCRYGDKIYGQRAGSTRKNL